MINQIFDISVRSYDFDGKKSKDCFRFFGADNAVRQGLEFGACDNVEAVDVIDVATGEVVLLMNEKEVTYIAIDFSGEE